MITHNLTLAEAVKLYEITENPELARKIATLLAKAGDRALMELDKAFEGNEREENPLHAQARIEFDDSGREYDYIWKGQNEKLPNPGDDIMVETSGRARRARLVEFIAKKPDRTMNYKNAYPVGWPF